MDHPKSMCLFLLLFLISCSPNKNSPVSFRTKDVDYTKYDVVYEPGNWDHPNYKTAFKSYGNHRAVVEVSDPGANPVQVKIPWRRRDDQPENKDIVVVNASTNSVVINKKIIALNNEYGHIIFQPEQSSTKYYIYYLPHSSTGSYYPKLSYDKPQDTADKKWLSGIPSTANVLEACPHAEVISLQSIDEFHSFFPMEVIATDEEAAQYFKTFDKPYYLFPEYRDYPIKLIDYLPQRWIMDTTGVNGIADDVFKGEYYTFQIGVFSPDKDLVNLDINFSTLKGDKGNSISSSSITCFNKEGIDLNGNPFTKNFTVLKGETQALWCGVEIPADAMEDTYTGQVIVQPSGMPADTVVVQLTVLPESIKNFGDDDPENMSRLRWLNSTIGTDPEAVIRPFTPIAIEDKSLHILGRKIDLDEYGMPENIGSFFTQEMTKVKEEKENILAGPVKLTAIDEDGTTIQWKSNDYNIDQSYPGLVQWQTINTSDQLSMHVSGSLEYDGMMDYQIMLVAEKDINLKDVNLQVPLEKETAKYILGLGHKGGGLIKDIQWKWDITKHQEGVWLGNVNKGLQYVLRDVNYERPLNTNFYQAKPLNLPPSWYNDGKGGINITRRESFVQIENYSGSRTMKKGDTLNFNIRYLITPFKTIDLEEHFNTRFVHKYVPVDTVIKSNGTIVNVHHANEINPYINYPFYNLEKQKAYIDEAHIKGVRVKLYNTIRELTYKAHELYALRSLGDEILNDGEGGGHSWLQEHLKSNYHSAWHATEVNDAAILNKGTSRWTNYYIEGINWLAQNQEIDGLYLDDIAFSRSTVKRIAHVFNHHRPSYVIDLHSANQYNDRDGFINSAFLYMEHFPYISRLWFGEYFEYDLHPDYWLTEVSGIPFGLTGEMLEKGGHPFRGLVYGMTTRVYGKYNPGALWNLFKDFDIAHAEMLGYWVDRSPIKTNTNQIKSSIYMHKDQVLIAIGSWSNKDEYVQLNIDWGSIGMDKNKATLTSPEIKGLQQAKKHQIDNPILVKQNEGLILILSKNDDS